jgi:hypothetical protein
VGAVGLAVNERSWAFRFQPCRVGQGRWEYAFYDGETLVVSGEGATEQSALEMLAQRLREVQTYPDAARMVEARLSALQNDNPQQPD